MYIIDLCNDDEFFDIEGIASFAKKMIKIKNDSSEKDFQIDIYMLIKLSLLLLIATAIVKRVFFAMHIIKSILQNKMIDKHINNNLIAYIEKDIFDEINNDVIMKRFQNIKN
jgi:hypothetical protein